MAKLLAVVKLPTGIEPTSLAFVNGVGMILITDSTSQLLGFKI
jgi:hypothetical protein